MKTPLVVCISWFVLVANANPIAVVPVVDTIDHPRYAFKYAVNDPVTHDNKAQWEIRDGDAVKGSYSLVEPDGSVRVVNYAADALTGFNAEVKNIGPSVHPTALFTPVIEKPVGPVSVEPAIVHHAEDVHLAPAVVPTHTVEPIHVVDPIHTIPIEPAISTVTSLGHWNLPWDHVTHSYGGWVPLKAPLLSVPTEPHVTVFSKKYENGKLYKWITGPISLAHNTLVIKHKH